MRTVQKRRLRGLRDEFQPRLKEYRYMLHLIRRSPLVIVGIILASIAIGMAIVGPWIAPYPEQQLFLETPCPHPTIYGIPAPCPPTPDHIWGLSPDGYDIYSRILYGARLDLSFSVAAVIVSAVVGLALGATSGYIGGKIDELIMRFTDVFLAFPGLVLAVAITVLLGASWNSIFIALIIVGWPAYTRLMRGQTLSVRENQFIESARAVGAGSRRIVFRHIIPHIIPQMFVYATIDIGGYILTLAALGFLGLAGNTTIAEWGNMLQSARGYMQAAPYTVLIPGLIILMTSLGFNLLGDGMRDILDPRLRR